MPDRGFIPFIAMVFGALSAFAIPLSLLLVSLNVSEGVGLGLTLVATLLYMPILFRVIDWGLDRF